MGKMSAWRPQGEISPKIGCVDAAREDKSSDGVPALSGGDRNQPIQGKIYLARPL